MTETEELRKKLISSSKQDKLSAVLKLSQKAAFDLDVPLELVPFLIKIVNDKNDQIASGAIMALTAYNVIEEQNGFLSTVVSTFAEIAADKEKSAFIRRTMCTALGKIATEFTYVNRTLPPDVLKALTEG